MKQVLCLISAVLCSVFLLAQSPILSLTTGKTVSLVFPNPIRHVDRGTKEVLVQPVKEADHILLVKAASTNLSETSLSVITTDGSIYTFQVCYGEPSSLVYQAPEKKKISISRYADAILNSERRKHGIAIHKWGMRAKLSGIYIKDNVLFFQLKLFNQSNLDYDIDYLRFSIRDRKQRKRTAIQEAEVTPLHITGNVDVVKASGQVSLVIATQRFTIPNAKHCTIELGEKNGGRHLNMKLGNRHLVKAITLTDFK